MTYFNNDFFLDMDEIDDKSTPISQEIENGKFNNYT